MKSVQQYFIDNGKRLISEFEKGDVKVADHLGIIIDDLEPLMEDYFLGDGALEVLTSLSKCDSPIMYLDALNRIYENFK